VLRSKCRRVLQTGENVLQSRDMVSFQPSCRSLSSCVIRPSLMVKASIYEASRHTTSTRHLGQPSQSHDNCSQPCRSFTDRRYTLTSHTAANRSVTRLCIAPRHGWLGQMGAIMDILVNSRPCSQHMRMETPLLFSTKIPRLQGFSTAPSLLGSAMAVICGQCDRTFNTGHVLEQHRRDSPAHAIPYSCEECDSAFNTEEALEQHRRDSPAHSVKHDCEECNRTFDTEQALEQHRRDSPVHSVKHDCEECNRTFDTEQALEQHLRDSPAHGPSEDTEQLDQSFDIRPTRHQDVSKLLRQYGLSFKFFPVDDPHGCLKEHDTSVMGRFTCTSSSCSSSRWTSKKIAISIRQYSDL